MKHLLYFCDIREDLDPVGELPAGYHWCLWNPTLLSLKPRGTPWYFVVWWLFHHIRVFRNRDYHVALIFHDKRIAHYSIVSPDYFRFPFMADEDLTVGDSWTDPEQRGKGLYSCVLRRVAWEFGTPGRKIWTIHAAGNEGSRKAFLRAGYRFVGHVERTKRFGSRLLGQYRTLTEEHQ